MSERYRCLLLFGAPGVGKGTQGTLLGARDGYIHVATGDIFRALDKESALGKKFVEYSSRGELVPNELTIELWKRHVAGLVATGQYRPSVDVLVLDGMPRSLAQAEMLDGVIEPLQVIHLTAPDPDAMVARIKRRCEKQGRHDDADETVIRKRFDVYESNTAPVLDHYDRSIICDIDAIGTIEEVFDRLMCCLDALPTT